LSKKEIYDNKLQIDYLSDSYIQFEEDFYKYSLLDTPLTFLTDAFLREMALSHKNYFKLTKENTKDNRNHFFYFNVETPPENKQIRIFHYQYCDVREESNGL
jgi:hypothetical protein